MHLIRAINTSLKYAALFFLFIILLPCVSFAEIIDNPTSSAQHLLDSSLINKYFESGGKLYTALKAKDYQFVFIFSDFRIFYSIEGKNKIIDATDLNENNVPDLIENVMLQFIAMRLMLTNSFGYDDPIYSPNSLSYHRGIKYIDIKFRDMRSKGTCSNKIVRDRLFVLAENGLHQGEVVSISLNNNLKSDSLVPTHELFHVYQNAVSRLRNSWFSEGTARWLENGMIYGISPDEMNYKLPATEKQLQKLFQSGYSAAEFWGKLSYLCDKRLDLSELFQHIQNFDSILVLPLTKYSYQGAYFLGTLLQNLQKQSILATREQGNERKLADHWEWPHEEQKSPRNNQYIAQAVLDTMNQHCTSGDIEVKKFSMLLTTHLELSEN